MARVIIKLKEGKEIEGSVLALSLNSAVRAFHVQAAGEGGRPENVVVQTDSVKAVFFLKKEEGGSSVVHTETIDQSVFAGMHGFRLHVEFLDGEMIHGTAHKYNPNDTGFYLVPLNPAERWERIYVNASAVKRVDSRRLMGKILVDQKKITPEQLGQALQYQRDNRDKKIGTILSENRLITQEQLESSLRQQKERARFIGEILLEAGYITEEQLQYALGIQQENRKKRLGQILVELRYLTPNDICIALATQFHMPWADLSSGDIPDAVASSLPPDVARSLEIIPVERKLDTLVVASADPQEPGLVGEISRYTKLKVKLAVAYEGYIEAALKRLFPAKE